METEQQKDDKDALSSLIKASEEIEKKKILDDGKRCIFISEDYREEFREKLKSV